jgi:hypothetical protein
MQLCPFCETEKSICVPVMTGVPHCPSVAGFHLPYFESPAFQTTVAGGVGVSVGAGLGVSVGAGDGESVGDAVGAGDGDSVGSGVDVGAIVGVDVGATVGEGEGDGLDLAFAHVTFIVGPLGVIVTFAHCCVATASSRAAIILRPFVAPVARE